MKNSSTGKNKITRRIFLPENLNLELFVKENPPGFPLDIEKTKCLLSLVVEKKAMYFNTDKNSGFANINSREFQRIDHDYARTKDYLVNSGILWSDSNYVNGKKATGYKFAPKYQKPVREDVVYKWSLIKKIDAEKHDMPTACRYLDKWLNNNLKIDYRKALETARRRFEEDLAKKDTKATDRYNCSLINIRKIHRGNLYFKRDKNVFRYHSNLTNIPQTIRDFIKYDGKQLIGIDIKSSQPTLSCLLFERGFWDGTAPFSIYSIPAGKRNKLLFNKKQIITIKQQQEHNTIYLMLAFMSRKPMNSDFFEYKKLIQEGQFYEYLFKNAPVHVNIKTREEAKNAMFYMMFSDNKDFYQWSGGFKRYFAEQFPDVFEVFEIIKSQDYTLLSKLLQLIESEIVIDRACKRIAKEKPKLFIATVHDSIVTTIGDEHYVENVLKEELTSVLGFQPRLAQQQWKDQ